MVAFGGNFETDKVKDNATTFEVKVESYTLITTKNFIHAVAIILTVHIVFNIAYALKNFGGMSFMQKYLLDIDDETNIQSKVLALFSELIKTIHFNEI